MELIDNVTPKLVPAGWGTFESVIGEQRSFTNGRIIVAGDKAHRGKQRRADTLVCYRSDSPPAVVVEPPCRRSQWHPRPAPRSPLPAVLRSS